MKARGTAKRVRGLVSSYGARAHFVEISGPVLAFDVDEYGLDVDDLSIPPPSEAGLWVWTGEYRWHPPGFEEEHGEYRIHGDGKYRRPTAREWARLSAGKPLWHARWRRGPAVKREAA